VDDRLYTVAAAAAAAQCQLLHPNSQRVSSTRIPDVYTHSQTDEGSFPGQKEILL
jgi:hypothetical protein